MNLSFYTAAVGASAHQSKLDVIGNNIANVNTFGYKTKSAGFVDLLYDNIRQPSGQISPLRQGVGARQEKTDTLFKMGALVVTEYPFDAAIIGDGFFALQNPTTNETVYSRSGNFQPSLAEDGQFYLIDPMGFFVLDSQGERIVIPTDMINSGYTNDTLNSAYALDVGIYDFINREGMIAIGNNHYRPVPKNGQPYLNEDSYLEWQTLEMSNVDLGLELTRVIQTQRAFQLNLRMVQTSDEIEQTINNLR
ncbi:MAG: flagellar hook-basal body protein [Oscillospiraceae bacterium]|nr:flagellar hook-basal body protein [Oscillospiraceae bacterium]